MRPLRRRRSGDQQLRRCQLGLMEAPGASAKRSSIGAHRDPSVGLALAKSNQVEAEITEVVVGVYIVAGEEALTDGPDLSVRQLEVLGPCLHRPGVSTPGQTRGEGKRDGPARGGPRDEIGRTEKVE